MAWIFTPRANTVARVAAAGLLATPVLGVLGLWAYARSPLAQNQRQPVPQPVQFDHRREKVSKDSFRHLLSLRIV